MAFVVGQPGVPTLSGRLFVVAREGNQALAYELSEDKTRLVHVALAPEYFPMRLFGGKALVAGSGEVYYDFADGWIPLTMQRRPRYVTRVCRWMRRCRCARARATNKPNLP
jgi:hypothetical protein